jgi:hypothetical protein
MMRDNLEPYKTLLLGEEDCFVERRLCHNELCCDFQVAMHKEHQDESTSVKDYVYRLAVFDGVRSFTFVTGGVHICAVLSCTNNTLSSCGLEFESSEDSAFRTVFDYIHISGNFRLDNSTLLPDTLVQGYGVLASDTFQFTREEIPEKRQVRIDMKTTRRISRLLTFAIFGRDFLKDGESVTPPSGIAGNNAASVFLLLSVTVLLFVLSHYQY